VEHLLVPALLTIKSNERKQTRLWRWRHTNIYATTGRGGFLRREAPDLTSRLIDPFSKSACLVARAPLLPRPITLCTHTRSLACSAGALYTHTICCKAPLWKRAGPLENTPKKLSRGKKNTRDRGCKAKYTARCNIR
jgi:hypothetical protein